MLRSVRGAGRSIAWVIISANRLRSSSGSRLTCCSYTSFALSASMLCSSTVFYQIVRCWLKLGVWSLDILIGASANQQLNLSRFTGKDSGDKSLFLTCESSDVALYGQFGVHRWRESQKNVQTPVTQLKLGC